MQTRHAQHREDAHLPHFLVNTFDDVFFRQRALFEELFHEGILTLGDDFDQFFVGEFRGFQLVIRDGDFLALAVAIHGVSEGFHAHQINDTAKILIAT